MSKDRQRVDTPIIAVVGTGWSVESAFTKYGAYSFCIRDKKDEKAAIQFADGLVFTGGGDIDPARYGENRWHPDVYGVSKERDTKEFRLVAQARKRGIPMFGICRGLQLLNVAHGGTLHQDIDQFDSTHLHHYGGQHDIYLRNGTGVQKHLDTMQVKGTSLHHQAIDRMGEGLLPAGASVDGLVEMIESAEGVWPYVLATQFHPEMDYKDKDNDAAGGIFQHFVNVCAEKAGRRKPLDIRKSAMSKARGFTTPTTTNHYGSRGMGTITSEGHTTDLDTWRERKPCPHGWKYHCPTSTLCEFDQTTGYVPGSGLGFTLPKQLPAGTGSEDISRTPTCTHGAIYHSTDDAGDGLPCHFDGMEMRRNAATIVEEADDDIDTILHGAAQDGWVWSESLEAWVPKDHDSDNDDSEAYREWLEVQARWNDALREVNDDDTPMTEMQKFSLYDDYDGWC